MSTILQFGSNCWKGRECPIYCCNPESTQLETRIDVQGQIMGLVATRERYWAWGRALKNWTMVASIGLDLAAGGIAIGKLYSSGAEQIGLGVGGFVLLSAGMLFKWANNASMLNPIAGLREIEGNSNAVGAGVPSMCVGLTGWGVGLSGMVLSVVDKSVSGDVLSVAAPLISAVGFTLTSTRFNEERDIIGERQHRHVANILRQPADISPESRDLMERMRS